jgi:acetoin utilization deacetylase AcuC-like enzyme
VFNDAAVAARAMQAEGAHAQIAIVDLDVHQGNGTASIFHGDPSVFTLSLHGESNYPFSKEASDLDVALPDGCDDDAYLEALSRALSTLFERCEPALILYLAGADPHEGDRLGRLALSLYGLARRDQLVFDCATKRDLPVAIAMAGGYGRDIDDTVEAHLQTVQLAAAACARRRKPADHGTALF